MLVLNQKMDTDTNLESTNLKLTTIGHIENYHRTISVRRKVKFSFHLKFVLVAKYSQGMSILSIE